MLIAIIILGWLFINMWLALIINVITGNDAYDTPMGLLDLLVFSMFGIIGSLVYLLIYKIKHMKNK